MCFYTTLGLTGLQKRSVDVCHFAFDTFTALFTTCGNFAAFFFKKSLIKNVKYSAQYYLYKKQAF